MIPSERVLSKASTTCLPYKGFERQRGKETKKLVSRLHSPLVGKDMTHDKAQFIFLGLSDILAGTTGLHLPLFYFVFYFGRQNSGC